jgi:hypothetical protein
MDSLQHHWIDILTRIWTTPTVAYLFPEHFQGAVKVEASPDGRDFESGSRFYVLPIPRSGVFLVKSMAFLKEPYNRQVMYSEGSDLEWEAALNSPTAVGFFEAPRNDDEVDSPVYSFVGTREDWDRLKPPGSSWEKELERLLKAQASRPATP